MVNKYELKMHDSINGVISELPRATSQESDKGIDHNLHISDMNIKLTAEKHSHNDKLLTIESYIAKLGICLFVFQFPYYTVYTYSTYDIRALNIIEYLIEI